MSRNGINYHDVANAAIKVQGHNDNPTVDRVREILGTGSKSTIARHLKDWRANNGPVANANGLPPELIAIIMGLWERLQSSAEQSILEFRQEANQKIQATENNFIQVQKKNVELQAQIQQLEEELYQQQVTHKNLNEILINERLEASIQQERVRSLEAHLTEHKQENIKLHTLLTNVQNNLEHYQDSMQKLQQEQALIAANQKSKFDQKLYSLRNQLLVSVNECNGLQLQIEKVQQTALALEHVQNNNHILEQTLQQKDMQINTLQEKHQEMVRQNARNNESLDSKIKQLIEANQKTAIAMSRLSDAEQALHKAEDKIAALRHEQLFIVQEKSNLEGQIKQLMATSEMVA